MNKYTWEQTQTLESVGPVRVQDVIPPNIERSVPERLFLAISSLGVGLLVSYALFAASGGYAAVFTVAVSLAFAGGVLSTWSPCGYSSLCLLRPEGRYSFHSVVGWAPTLFTHALGYTLGVGVLGGGLGLIAWLLPIPALSGWPLLAVGVLAIGYGLHCLDLLRMPYPERRIQVSHGSRNRHAMWIIGWSYGAKLGLNFLTYVRSPILYVVVALALVSGSVASALALIAALNFGRWLPLIVNAFPVRDQDVQSWLAANEQNAKLADGMWLAVAGMAFVVFGLIV